MALSCIVSCLCCSYLLYYPLSYKKENGKRGVASSTTIELATVAEYLGLADV